MLGNVYWDLRECWRLQEILWVILKELEVGYSWRYYQQKQIVWPLKIPHLKDWRWSNLIQGICCQNERRIERYLLHHWWIQSCCLELPILGINEEERLWNPLLGWPYWWVHGLISQGLWWQETQILHQRRSWSWRIWGREKAQRRRES